MGAELGATPVPAQDLKPGVREVLSLLARGRSNAQFAAELGAREQTVGNYLGAVYNKLNVHFRTEAVLWVRDHGLGAAPDTT